MNAITATARQQLEDVLLPYWLQNGVDEVFGGFATCFDNQGRTQTSTDKFTWSQGRFVWLLARAAELSRTGLLSFDAEMLLKHARAGATFIASNVIRPDGTCEYVVGRDGSAPESANQPARSVYADCFAVMGLTELARVAGEPQWLNIAEPVLRRARRDILAEHAPTPPYPIPAGYSAYGPRMILLNTLTVVGAALRADPAAYRHTTLLDEHAGWLGEALSLAMTHRLPDGTFAEMTNSELQAADSLITRHRVPGHAIEGAWIALEAMKLLDDWRWRDSVLASIPVLCALGWDETDGGLLRYVDAAGGTRPCGRRLGSEYERAVLRTWDTKLWWVHTEAIAATAIASDRYGLTAAEPWLARVWDYTLSTFPGRDEGAEWIQIRDRSGRPLETVVALPVKDPFHIIRNFMQLLELRD